MADGRDHSLRFPENENHLGFKVENGPGHILHGKHKVLNVLSEALAVKCIN